MEGSRRANVSRMIQNPGLSVPILFLISLADNSKPCYNQLSAGLRFFRKNEGSINHLLNIEIDCLKGDPLSSTKISDF